MEKSRKKIRYILNNILYKLYEDFKNEKYGNEILGLNAIPIIVHTDIVTLNERKYISRKEKISDVRLIINYDIFEKSNFEQCVELVYQNCYDSFYIVYERSKKYKNGDFYNYFKDFISKFRTRYYNYVSLVNVDIINEFNSL